MKIKELNLYKSADKLQQALGNIIMFSDEVHTDKRVVTFPIGKEEIRVLVIHVAAVNEEEVDAICPDAEKRNLSVQQIKTIIEQYFKAEQIKLKVVLK